MTRDWARRLVDGWLSMDTAPEDGTVVLGDYGDSEPVRIRWADERHCVLASVAPGAGMFGPGWEDELNHLAMETPLRWKPAPSPADSSDAAMPLPSGRTPGDLYRSLTGDGQRDFVTLNRADVVEVLARVAALAARADEVRALREQVQRVRKVCDEAEHQATRWEHPLPVPQWVADVRAAIGGGS